MPIFSFKCKHSLVTLVTVLLALIIIMLWGYDGIIHDARLYAADLARPDHFKNDLISLSPQKDGSVFSLLIKTVSFGMHVESVFALWYAIVFIAGLLGIFYLLRMQKSIPAWLAALYATVFVFVQWEVLMNVIRMNERFLTARRMAEALCILALFCISKALSNEASVNIRFHKIKIPEFIAGLLVGFALLIHPITAIYIVPLIVLFRGKFGFSAFAGFICGAVPLLCKSSLFASVMTSEEAINPDIINAVRDKQHLFLSSWTSDSLYKIAFQFVLSGALIHSLRDKIWKKALLIQLCVTGCAVIILSFIETIWYQPFIIAAQPVRATWVMNLILYISLVVWIHESGDNRYKFILRQSIFIMYVFSQGVLFPLYAAVTLTVVVFEHKLITNKTFLAPLLSVFFIVIGLLSIKGSILIFTTVIVVLIVSVILHMPLVTVCIIYTVFVLYTDYTDMDFIRRNYKVSKEIALNLLPSISPEQTIASPEALENRSMDLYVFRYTSPACQVYYDMYDNAPTCFSPHYAAEVFRRESVLRKIATQNYQPDSLKNLLHRERIDFILSRKNYPLEIAGAYKDYFLYRVDLK
jgi:hypothetical protein